MQIHLTDLDALLLTVRQPLSRSYIQEAIQAYRAGSYKAAIVAVYVAVTFDIINKVRELSESDDKKAIAFIKTFDANVQSNNTIKLLEIEGQLLETAEVGFEFIDPITRRHFDRLKQDRNICAHPAFTADGQLFMPEPELVRLYIVEAVRNLLSQRPLQGRAIIDQFDREFRSTSFPSSPAEITRFVKGRYLENSRSGAHTSLAAVFAKALLKATPAGWAPKLPLLLSALQAVKDTDASAWSTSILPSLITLVEDADDDHLPNAYGLIARFKDLRDAIPNTALTRLQSFIENLHPVETDVRAFEAATIAEFEGAATAKLEVADYATQVAVFSRFPVAAYWPIALGKLRAAGSFRGAEALFSGCISPFGATADPVKMVDLFQVVAANKQIFYASGVPAALELFVASVGQRHPLHIDHILPFIVELSKDQLREVYERVLIVFANSGVVIPPPPPEQKQ